MKNLFCPFPQSFLWGAATASYQVEGAAAEDGRTPSVWDRFCRRPGAIAMDHTGDRSTDHYHLYRGDVALMKELGIQAYRFSISWSRVLPDPEGPPNAKGLDFYRRLVDELLAAGVQPWATLFHWDLPQWAEDRFGGWESKECAQRLGDLAHLIGKTLGDRLAGVFTINEFVCFLDKGYGADAEPFAPGKRCSKRVLNQARHHAIYGHGLAVQAFRAAAHSAGRCPPVGIAENLTGVVPLLETPEYLAVARDAMRYRGGMYLTPIMEGAYHPDYIKEQGGDAPVYTDEEMRTISTALDFVGLNLYAPEYIRTDASAPRGWVTVPHDAAYPRLDMPWLALGPSVLYWAPRLVSEIWNPPAIYITENGCANPDRPNEQGEILDTARVMYLQNHLIHAHRAVAEGYPLRGYFLWSLLDNFEWAYGYTRRFGICYTNYETLQRTPKLSARFYADLIRRNAIGGPSTISAPKPAAGFEGQRRADLGDGTYLNPVVSGDHPDPTVLKDGDDYYMTFSSFFSYPGVIVWHSRDLINWAPIGPALIKPLGTIWAMDLVKYDGRYFIYIPAISDDQQSIFVIHTDNIRGPWSDPIDLKVSGCIDPGHAVGEDGKRYLFFNGVRRIALTDDGLATVGALEQVYNPWRYPDDWVVETFAPEGPKLFRRGDWFYLVAAVGGTAGPPTSHMVIVARSHSIHGPWEDCPHNPIVHTQSAEEPWWSRGHATVLEGPGGDWWMIYHGYENGFRTLGRQTLLEPIEWTDDGWFHARGGTLSQPLAKPRNGQPGPSGFALSDDFSTNKFGVQWSFFNPRADELNRARYAARALTISGKGTTLADCSPLTFLVGDRSYEAEITLDIGAGAQAGICLFYSERMFCGIGFSNTQMFTYVYGQEHSWMRQEMTTKSVRLRVANHANIVTFSYQKNTEAWVKHPWQMEVSGYHANVFGGFLSLKFGVYCTGTGEAKLRAFVYRAL